MRDMELGIGMFGDLSFDFQNNKYQSAAERLKEIIEEVKTADEAGIDSFSMGEHHREDYAVSSPEIILASLAAVTEKIKLSSGVNVIGSVDPVKLYQDYSMIDLISNNRVEIMAGRGSFTESFPLFGYDLEDYDELFEEKLDLLLKLRKTEEINWSGKYRAPIVKQTVYPRPQREIPISIAVGGTPSSVLRAARLGLPVVFAIIGGNPLRFKPLIDYYKEAYVKFGHDLKNMRIGVHSHTFLTDSSEEIIENYYLRYAYSMNKIGRERGWTNSYTVESFKAGMSPDGALYMGNPDYVAEKIIVTVESLEIDQFIAHIDVGGPTHGQTMKNIDLLGGKVFPTVKKYFKN